MRGPKPAVLELKETEREELEALVRKHSTTQQIAQRGRMILLAAEGKNNEQVARELGACADTVRTWRMRWPGWQKLSLEDFSIPERLRDLPRPGRPSEITAEQFCQLITLRASNQKNAPSLIGRGARLPTRSCNEASFHRFLLDTQLGC